MHLDHRNWAFAAVCLLVGCWDNGTSSGSDGGGCSVDLDCKGARVCVAGECVDPMTSDDGSTVSTSGDGTASDSSGGSGGTSPGDACAEQGGETLPFGYCYKQCTWDSEVPGNDLFEDCLGLGMVCYEERDEWGPDFCFPPDWFNDCATDDDCQPGGKCVLEYGIGGIFVDEWRCYIECNSDSDCGSQRCVTSCPDGGFDKVNFCHTGYGWGIDEPYPSPCTP